MIFKFKKFKVSRHILRERSYATIRSSDTIQYNPYNMHMDAHELRPEIPFVLELRPDDIFHSIFLSIKRYLLKSSKLTFGVGSVNFTCDVMYVTSTN